MDFQALSRLLELIPKLDERVAALEAKNAFLEKMTVKLWVRRDKCKEIIDICDVTLGKIANDSNDYIKGRIRRKYEGSKPLYLIEDIHSYLESKGRSSNEILRVMVA